jgi:hypothetical protein
MKLYVLIDQEDDKPTFNLPVHFGRGVRAYSSQARARVYARRFNCYIVEVDMTKGNIVYEPTRHKD